MKNSFQQKCQLVFRATKKHASNLARFATIYKLAMLALKYYGPTPGKEGAHSRRLLAERANKPPKKQKEGKLTQPTLTGPLDSLMAGMLGGYIVFGQRSKRTGKVSSVSQQIVIYIFARVCLGLAHLAVKPGAGFPIVSNEPLRSSVNYYAWPAFASLSWGMVMLLFRYHPDELQSSLRSSMTYIYKDCNSWDSLRTLVWHNK